MQWFETECEQENRDRQGELYYVNQIVFLVAKTGTPETKIPSARSLEFRGHWSSEVIGHRPPRNCDSRQGEGRGLCETGLRGWGGRGVCIEGLVLSC